MDGQVRLPIEELRPFVSEIFAKVGMTSDDAQYCSDCLIQTNLWGVESHGVLRLPIYVQRLRKGVISAIPQVGGMGGAGAFIVLDADNGMGFPCGRAAMERAVSLAAETGIGAVAGGKLLLAAKNREKIPLDWATDKDGRFTDDPVKAFQGFLLPLGGHKRFGLSLVVDMLCGGLSGGAFQFALKGMYKEPDSPSETGDMMIAIDPAAVMERHAFLDRMGAFYRTIKASPMWDADKEMMLPGEIEHRTQVSRMVEGIPLSEELFDELNQLAEQVGVSANWSRQ